MGACSIILPFQIVTDVPGVQTFNNASLFVVTSEIVSQLSLNLYGSIYRVTQKDVYP